MNWTGLICIGLFYLMVLGVGIFAGFVQRRKLKDSVESQADVVLLAKRDLGGFVGIGGMTGKNYLLAYTLSEIKLLPLTPLGYGDTFQIPS